jgi:hypothetical protein
VIAGLRPARRPGRHESTMFPRASAAIESRRTSETTVASTRANRVLPLGGPSHPFGSEAAAV